ncbi:MAG: hypothetical protein COS26_03180, partial [Candidatus Nealsonbacteria bacterium CG02_land_8_20_14_3_00_40_11]
MLKEKIQFNFSILIFFGVLIFSSVLLMVVFVPEAQAGNKTYSDEVHWDAVIAKGAGVDKYYNWTGWQDCPGTQGGCYLSRIELINRTFTNTGSSGTLAPEGSGYIRIADSAGSDCTTPSLATFYGRVAHSPAMYGGVSDTANDCGALTSPNTCSLTSGNGFGPAASSSCFSIHSHGDYASGGGILFSVTTISVNYTWTFIGLAPPETPILKSPGDSSTAPASPVVLSWGEAADAVYYEVRGDTNTTPTTLLATTTNTTYQWSLPLADVYYWNVRAANATSGETTVYSATSTTWSFTYDPCAPGYGTPYYTYPMYYTGTSTDTIIVWGDDGTGTNCGQEGNGNCAAMGYSTSTAITFENIYEFGQAVRGICAITKPAAGSYAVLSKIDMGNNASTTYVRTTGESIDFGKQIRVTDNTTFISGLLTAQGSPYAGSTLSSSGQEATSTD